MNSSDVWSRPLYGTPSDNRSAVAKISGRFRFRVPPKVSFQGASGRAKGNSAAYCGDKVAAHTKPLAFVKNLLNDKRKKFHHQVFPTC
jgi:hypothetical protein